MTVKSTLIFAAILLQIVAVASIAISKELVLKSGQQFILQTAPIDPTDIFKGDYVKLNYSFSKIPYQQLDNKIKQYGLKKGQKVYLSISTDKIGITQAEQLYLEPTDADYYLTGYVTAPWPYRGFNIMSAAENQSRSNKHPVSVKYGVEQFYVEQGQGKVMEEIRGSRDSFQRPMLVKVAVSDSGNAIIHSFAWANIAMKTEIIKSPDRDAPDDQASAIMRFTIKNKSGQSITLPLKQNGCSFQLTPTTRNPQQQNKAIFIKPQCSDAITVSTLLKTDETVSVEVDLNHTQWQVEYKNKPMPLGKLPWDYRYRIIFEGELPEKINAKIISSAFHGGGNID